MSDDTLFDSHYTQSGRVQFTERSFNNGPTLIRNDAPITSIEAGQAAEATSGKTRRIVYDAIAAAGSHGLTLEEIESCTGLDGNCVRPRRKELERDGYVVFSGEYRLTRSGKRAQIWIVATPNKAA